MRLAEQATRKARSSSAVGFPFSSAERNGAEQPLKAATCAWVYPSALRLSLMARPNASAVFAFMPPRFHVRLYSSDGVAIINER